MTRSRTRTRTRSHPVRLLAGVAGLACAATLLTGCSEDDAAPAGDVVARQQAAQVEEETLEQEAVERRHAALPGRPAGVVELDGSPRGSLTPQALDRFAGTGSSVTVEVADNGEDVAFGQLCAGEIDLVDSTRPISRAEWDACRSVGLDVVQFQIAADAVVVAVKSESDVGGDCLSTEQVRDIYRAGSPVTSWEHVGLDAVPLVVGGPDPENSAFGFFGRNVLGTPQPGLTNLRSDYHAFDSDQGSRVFVVGDEEDERLAEEYADRARARDQARSALVVAQQVLDDAQDEVSAAWRERAKGIADRRSPADLARDRQRVRDAIAARDAARAELAVVREKWVRVRDRFVVSRDARRRDEQVRGHVAYFRFSYYELFEDQLRPFEITTPEGERNCIFPSQRTITSGEYPLARQLLVTTTVRSLDRREVRVFLESYLGDADRLAEDTQLVPLPEATVRTQLSWLTGDVPPPLVSPDAPVVEEGAEEQPAPQEQPAR
ncbi:substrate-binding domain-containing protein [Nocardioides marmotae]|uniref:substrate-binding domain-containing protein n=1 Tax=Nocardioides marmotae TaxID=2663857 RepID=UPI0012B5F806|nr:substrate-binding domain-containing protein [Nocardioides marmotae]MBC9733072.1 substrate-binding domain-containing protein [Nocardioides marmotae]MTB84186.1 hypothetical protein [Nocardioides marmotae]